MSTPFPRSTALLDKLVRLEAFLAQVVLYLLMWVIDDYLAVVVSFILGGISLAIYLISKLIELVDKSNVPKVYYRFMLICLFAPIIAGMIGLLLLNGLSWVE
jgi:hypothetical protein